MNRLRSLAVSAALFSACWVPQVADAAQVKMGLGANYWFDRGALFDVTVAATGRVARNFDVGGRFGAFLATDPNAVGVPVDLLLRANIDQLYLEFLAGPWIRFEDDPLLGHAAFGFGIQSGRLSFGIEIGYLSPDPIAGLNLGIRF